ncbi:MAG: hypothetical protein IPL52_17105 [Flavobacteriales bacterium]|nr:hypothetical protein [Flavobacteriales bacterium]
MRSRTNTIRWTIIVLSSILLSTACDSRKPAKYRKKRGCDCPHWNHVPAPKDGMRSMAGDPDGHLFG